MDMNKIKKEAYSDAKDYVTMEVQTMYCKLQRRMMHTELGLSRMKNHMSNFESNPVEYTMQHGSLTRWDKDQFEIYQYAKQNKLLSETKEEVK